MDYQTFKPSPDLESFIKCFWSLKIPKESAKGKQQILPDGCLEMIFILGNDVKRYTSNEDYIIQPRSMILGQITKPYFIEPTGYVDTFAVCFYPDGLSNFIDTSIDSLSDTETELTALFDENRVNVLEYNITNANDTLKRIKIIENFLLSILKQNTNVDDLVKSTLDIIFSTNGRIGITEILKNNQNKRRTLERKFSKILGLSPKQLCKIIRLQAILKTMLNDENKSLTGVAYENHYFDQSHFIKDFKDFTGVNPKEFYKDRNLALSSIFYRMN